MKKAYFFNLTHLINYPFCKELENRGFEIVSLFFPEKGIYNYSKKLKILEDQRYMDPEFIKENLFWDQIYVDQKKHNYLSSKRPVNLENFKLEKDDRIFCFNEEELFETSCLGNKFLTPLQALSFSSKHIYYRKLGINYKRIYSIKQFMEVKEGFILKPSFASTGKTNVFKISSEKEKLNVLQKYPNLFNNKRLFIAMPIINKITEIWVFTLFDKNGQPYLLWFLTENGHATKSPFENDIKDKILKINEKLQIKNWMACMQFLLDEKGELHFIDLNPRIPGNDDWYELVYKYLTGKRLSKIILDLILESKIPEVIKNDKYIYEDEYQDKYKDYKNTKVWEYTDHYKKKPILFFRKYQ